MPAWQREEAVVTCLVVTRPLRHLSADHALLRLLLMAAHLLALLLLPQA